VVEADNPAHAMASLSRTMRIELGVYRARNIKEGKSPDHDEYQHMKRSKEALRTVRKYYRRHKPTWGWNQPVPFVTVSLIPPGMACSASYFGYGANGDRSIVGRKFFQTQDLLTRKKS
jgi:hypothetical protein